jgi:aspartoacylase
LNRQFSYQALHGTNQDDGLPRTVESLRAIEINRLLGPKFESSNSAGESNSSDEGKKEPVDVIIDLHSTTSNMGVTLIVTEGDPLMTQAAAYVMQKCPPEDRVRCVMHTHPNRNVRPNLSSIAPHGFTIEVGPVPQGVLRHEAVEKTQRALHALLEFLDRRISAPAELQADLKKWYASKNGQVPCFRSITALREGEMSGKITWPSASDNPNFPAYMVHKRLQDRDFELIKIGDPVFVDLEGNTIKYDGSHGSPVYLMFVNEGGYYFKSSGTGMAVAVRANFDLETGELVQEDDREDEL